MSIKVMKKALEVMHYLEALNSDTQLQKAQTIAELKEAISEAEKQEPFVWNEPTPDFYITELSRNTIRFHNAVHGRQEFSKKQMGDCVVPVYYTTPPAKSNGYVYLVATGETYEGQETYQRYEGSPPPLCDFEVLYTYTAQPKQQEWVGLTEEQLLAVLVDIDPDTKRLPPGLKSFAHAIEARLKEKNTKPLDWKEEKNSLVQKVSNETCASVDAREEFGFAPMSLKGSSYKVRGV